MIAFFAGTKALIRSLNVQIKKISVEINQAKTCGQAMYSQGQKVMHAFDNCSAPL